MTVTLASTLAAISFCAEVSATPTLVTKSPFLPPGFSPPGSAGSADAPPASVSQFEFRGVYQMEGQYYFNLYNTRDKKGTWVTEAASGEDTPRVIRFDLEGDVLVVESAGEQLSLTMVETSNRPMPLPAARRASVPKANQAKKTAASSAQTPVRRRVIRPTTRTTNQKPARRPTIPANQPTP